MPGGWAWASPEESLAFICGCEYRISATPTRRKIADPCRRFAAWDQVNPANVAKRAENVELRDDAMLLWSHRAMTIIP